MAPSRSLDNCSVGTGHKKDPPCWLVSWDFELPWHLWHRGGLEIESNQTCSCNETPVKTRQWSFLVSKHIIAVMGLGVGVMHVIPLGKGMETPYLGPSQILPLRGSFIKSTVISIVLSWVLRVILANHWSQGCGAPLSFVASLSKVSVAWRPMRLVACNLWNGGSLVEDFALNLRGLCQTSG